MHELELNKKNLNPPVQRRIISAITREPLGFPGATVYFSMMDKNGVRIIDRKLGTIAANSSGVYCIVRYQWATGDTDTVGYMRGQFLVIPTSGLPFNVPAGNRFIPIVIGRNIAIMLTTSTTTTTT